MFLWPVVLIGLALALVTRRPLGNLLARKFDRIELLLLGLGLQLLLAPTALAPILSTSTAPGLPRVGGLLYVGSLVSLLVFAWLNRRCLGVAVMGVGLLMNTAVIAANGGQMPVSPDQMAVQGSLNKMLAEEGSGNWSPHTMMGDETRLAFLGDWVLVMVPRPVAKSVIVSPGDLVVAAGVLLFLLVIPEAKAAHAEDPTRVAAPQ